jgi:hypothetical protein
MVNSYYHSSGAQHTIIDEHVQKASPHGRCAGAARWFAVRKRGFRGRVKTRAYSR